MEGFSIKKLFALALALTMAVPAVAVDATVGENGSQDINVTAKYSHSISTPKVYSVDIEWTDMTFTYSETGTQNWNAADHTYSNNTSSDWDKTTATVTVTNHSNDAVDVVMEYVPVADTGVNGALTNAAGTLDAGVVNAYDAADSLTATLTISGTPSAAVTAEGITVGTITVKIS